MNGHIPQDSRTGYNLSERMEEMEIALSQCFFSSKRIKETRKNLIFEGDVQLLNVFANIFMAFGIIIFFHDVNLH